MLNPEALFLYNEDMEEFVEIYLQITPDYNVISSLLFFFYVLDMVRQCLRVLQIQKVDFLRLIYDHETPKHENVTLAFTWKKASNPLPTPCLKSSDISACGRFTRS